MFIPLLQRERSIDDFIDKEEGCRLGALLADNGTVSQEEKLYLKEIRGLVREALIHLDEREQHIIRNRFGLLGGTSAASACASSSARRRTSSAPACVASRPTCVSH
jgi:DNA-directed RNA polymerase sigma subunit (sigma70/sigma32)